MFESLETPTQIFSCEYHKIFKNTYFKNIFKWLLLCTTPDLPTIIFQIHTELLLHVQLSLLHDIFYVISVNSKI